MTIIPITKSEPACYGLMCPSHEQCTRYHAAEGTPLQTLDTCSDEGSVFPLFVQRQPGQVPT